MLNGLNFVLAHVPSIAEVLPFYTEKLEFEVETQVPGFVQFKQPNGQGDPDKPLGENGEKALRAEREARKAAEQNAAGPRVSKGVRQQVAQDPFQHHRIAVYLQTAFNNTPIKAAILRC